jgi:hypothetical protein
MALNFPATPTDGQIYVDAASGNQYRYDLANTKWKYASNNYFTASVLGSVPSGATPGQLWWNSEYGRLLVYYSDGDSSQWVDTSPYAETGFISDQANLALLIANTTSNSVASISLTANLAYANANTKLANTANTFYAGYLNFPIGAGISIGVGTPITDIYLNGSAAAVINTLVDGATVTPIFGTNNNFTLTLGGNRAIANPTGPTPGQSGTIYLIQDATGGRTLTWGNTWRFQGNTAPTLSTTANAVDMLVYSVRTTANISAQLITNIG